jgi:hypothetical protein
MKALFWLPHWWKNGVAPARAPVPFQVACACGEYLQGLRQAHHQVIRCSRCGQPLFILPASALPPVAPLSAAPATPPSSASVGLMRQPWFWPAVAGGLSLLAVIVLFVILVISLAGERSQTPNLTPGDIDLRLAEARKALLGGNFAQALQQLDALQAVFASQARSFSTAQRQDLRQLHRQAAVLVDWPREPLQQVLARIAQLKAEEWRAVAGRYRGKTFVFAVDVRRDASHQYQVKVLPAGKTAPAFSLELRDLKVLSRLPLEEPQRLLLAARISDIQREGSGPCTVRLEPDSGVLLTDLDATALGGVLPEAGVAAILKQQEKWAAESP